MTYRGYISDLACPEQGRRDGTIYRGEEVIPGAPQTIAELRRRGCRAGSRGLSLPVAQQCRNKPLERRQAYAEKLTRLGIPTSPDEVINSSLVLACYLANSLWRNSAANMGWPGPQSLLLASRPCWRS